MLQRQVSAQEAVAYVAQEPDQIVDEYDAGMEVKALAALAEVPMLEGALTPLSQVGLGLQNAMEIVVLRVPEKSYPEIVKYDESVSMIVVDVLEILHWNSSVLEA